MNNDNLKRIQKLTKEKIITEPKDKTEYVGYKSL